MLPSWLEELGEGLYGCVDAFMDELEVGRTQEGYDRLEASNVLHRADFRYFLYGGTIPGCADSVEEDV